MSNSQEQQLMHLHHEHATSLHQDIEKKADTQQHAVSVPLKIPEGGTNAWLTVAGIFLFNFATWASNSAYAVFLAHYIQYNTFSDATKIDYAAIGGLCFGAGLVFGPLVRLVVNFVGLRATIIIGGCIQFLGLMLAAFSTKLWEMYLTQGLLSGIGLAFIIIPSLTLIPQWFRKKRSLASAISAIGSGAGGIVFVLGLEHAIQVYGIRWSLIIEAIVCAVCVGTGVLLVRLRHDHKIVLKVWDWNIMRFTVFWLYVAYATFTVLGFMVLLYNLADFTISLGYSAHDASIVAACIAVGNIIGRPTVGRLCDRFGTVTTAGFVHLFVAVFCFAMWIPARKLATAIAFAIITGGTAGTIWVIIGVMAARLVGLQKLDVMLSMIWVFIGSVGITSPVIGMELRGSAPEGQEYSPDQYRDPSIWCGAMYSGAALSLWLIRGYLIARDREAEAQKSHEDNDELHITVPWSLWMREMFSLSKTRKV